MPYDFSDLIIFEMANNHQGDVGHGLKIIEEMAKIKRKYNLRAAVKLQYRDLDTFIHPQFAERKDVKHIPRFIETRLRWEDFQSLVLATKEQGMLSVITAFDELSVEMALNHGVDILKIASCSAMDWPLLEKVAFEAKKTSKPVICSTGGCNLEKIDKIVTFFEHRGVSNLALLHCIGIYPTEDRQQQLNFMKKMMVRYPHCAVGYSGHEAPSNLRVAMAAVAMGAKILERHIGVPTKTIKLNAYSMNPEEADKWAAEVIAARRLCGAADRDKEVSEAELSSLRSLQRGVYTKVPIKKNEGLRFEAIFFAMPLQEKQTSAWEYIETMKASRDYAALEPVVERRPYDPVYVMRSVVHEAKGFLREAHISLGSDYRIELSHHYGMENFRRYGAIIIDFVNREYCKKLIILLPGQFHPSHFHEKKEETFQVLYGDLELVLDGIQRLMKPGEMQLVRQREWHSFSTKTGVVFEEISTRHIVGDSVYEDERIAKLDPMLRKTIIDSW